MDFSPAEIGRRFQEIERKLDNRLTKEVYDVHRKTMEDDIAEIKDQLRWQNRLLISNFAALLISVLVFLLGRP